MAQIKIYGLRETLTPIKARLSDVIHACVVEALKFPPDKRAHRFFPLEREDFYSPAGRTDQYIIIEIMMIEGRTVETKKQLIRLLFERINRELGISLQDIEIAIMEAPKHNWGFRGKTGDEVEINYKIEV
ncbi:MAG: tautomerase family protein [Anaerolineae bacterium]|nr:tautomerase family protein [Anaerolineae bacterium]